MSFLETRNMHSPTSLSVANLTIVTGCHCVMLRSSPWLVRQDKDIVLFSLTCGSRLDLVDFLGGDPVDLLELSWSCWFFRKGSCLVLVDLLGGDLIRNDRTLASHHLGRARVVRERDKSVQVGHLPARLNLGDDNWTSWIKQEPECNQPALGRAKDVLEGAPSGPSRRSQSCNSASWSSPFPSPSGHKTGGWRDFFSGNVQWRGARQQSGGHLGALQSAWEPERLLPGFQMLGPQAHTEHMHLGIENWKPQNNIN